MRKKTWVLMLASVAMNTVFCDLHQLRTVGVQKKVLTSPGFKTSMRLMLNSSVGMLQMRVVWRTAFLSDRVEKKCAKK